MVTDTSGMKRTFNFCFLDLNTATEEEICSVPLIGPEHAHQLVERRPFHNLEEVRQVPGILREHYEALIQAGAVVSLECQPRI